MPFPAQLDFGSLGLNGCCLAQVTALSNKEENCLPSGKAIRTPHADKSGTTLYPYHHQAFTSTTAGDDESLWIHPWTGNPKTCIPYPVRRRNPRSNDFHDQSGRCVSRESPIALCFAAWPAAFFRLVDGLHRVIARAVTHFVARGARHARYAHFDAAKLRPRFVL